MNQSALSSIANSLADHISAGLKELFDYDLPASQVVLQETRKEFRGDYTLVVFPFTRFTKKSPEQTAMLLGAYLMDAAHLSHFNVEKGFLNLEVSNEPFLNLFSQAFANDSFGKGAPKDERIMVEYASPNTNKPLHLGHMRTIFLGAAVSNLLENAGYIVTRANLVNDRGIHICKSMLAYQKLGHGETPESSGMKGDKLVGKYYVLFDQHHKKEVADLMAAGFSADEAAKSASWFAEAQDMLRRWEEGDEETLALWRKMNGWVLSGFEESYRQMDIHFDRIYFESNTYLLGKDIIDEGLDKGIFYKQEDGSVWADLTAEGLDHKLVLRGDGTSVYITQDLGTADLKFKDYNINRSIHVVGNEQDYHFQVLFHILRRLGRSYAPGLYHLSYGMVDLPSGKMKSREGTVVDADDLMAEMIETAKERTQELGKFEGLGEQERENLYHQLGIGAIKYYLLRVEPQKRMTFNPAESIELHGNTATAIQYVHARASSVLRKASEAGLDYIAHTATGSHWEADERELLLHLLKLEDTAAEAAEAYAPSQIAHYAYELSRLFNKFFTTCSILQAETEEKKLFRLQLTHLTVKTLKLVMGMLGIQLPERM